MAALALAGCGSPTSGPTAGRSPTAGGSPTADGSPTTGGSPSAPASRTATQSTAPATLPPGGSGSSSFQVLSMTFVSDRQGFALGTFGCGSKRCNGLLTTTNGGTSWAKLPAPTAVSGGPYNTCPSSRPCVSQLRFATPLIGYAFGPSLFLTADGGRTWRQVHGLNVSSLEAADGNVARVASSGAGCSGMRYDVQSGPAGSTAWQLLNAPQILMICPPVLYHQGQRLVLVSYGNAAGGVRATAQIARSDNGGATWSTGPDQCGGRDGYASAVTIAPPDVLTLLCRHQMSDASGDFGAPWIRVSVNGGATFGPDQVVRVPGGLPTSDVDGYQLAAASATRLLIVAADQLNATQHRARVYLSDNGGRTWSAALASSGAGPVILVGFEDPLTARIAQGDLVWTTYDGGRRWITEHFPNLP